MVQVLRLKKAKCQFSPEAGVLGTGLEAGEKGAAVEAEDRDIGLTVVRQAGRMGTWWCP